jgi:hypothetical protein
MRLWLYCAQNAFWAADARQLARSGEKEVYRDVL